MKTECGHCGQHLEFDQTMFGDMVKCPTCSSFVRLLEGQPLVRLPPSKRRSGPGRQEAFIRTECGHCGQHLEFEQGMFGDMIKCPNCSLFVRLLDREQVVRPDGGHRADARELLGFGFLICVVLSSVIGGFLIDRLYPGGVGIAGWPFLTVLAAGLAFAIYFVPAFVAYKLDHKDFTSILVLNVSGGWTLAGWLLALIWAVKK